jgi:hypothetical protein
LKENHRNRKEKIKYNIREGSDIIMAEKPPRACAIAKEMTSRLEKKIGE